MQDADARDDLQIGVQKGADIAEWSLEGFQRFMDVNATGMFLVAREATKAMRAQELRPSSATRAPSRGDTRGAIVNLASAASLIASPGVLPYTTSKHAAIGLTKNAGECHRTLLYVCMYTACTGADGKHHPYPMQPSTTPPTGSASTAYAPRGCRRR